MNSIRSSESESRLAMVADEIIVLGGGHNGLVCACYLAEAGCKVRVLERRSIVGGAAVTEEFHPGFRNSTASYTVGLLDPNVIRDLKLHDHGLEIIPRPMANFLPLSEANSLSIPNEETACIEEFARFSRRDAEALPVFRARLREIGDFVLRLMDRTPPNSAWSLNDWFNSAQMVKDFTGLSSEDRRFLMDLFLMSGHDLLTKWFENPHIQAALAFDAAVGNHVSLHAQGSAYGLLHHALGEVNGQRGVWGHAVGGMGAITQAMSARAQELGVKIETNADVCKVEIENDCAAGVRLADTSRIEASTVIANVAPKHLYMDLVDQSNLEAEFLRRVETMRTESAVLRMNVALAELPQFTCKPNSDLREHHQSGIVIAPTLDYMENAYLDARTGRWSSEPVIEMLIPSTVDDSLAPPGQHVASLFCQHFPYARDWDKHADAAADDVFNTIDRFAPNFSKSVIAREVLTPLDLERRFRLPRGDIFHAAHDLNQLWINRPMLGYAAYRGPVKGLYHCGAGAHPGGGVTGIPGRNAAREVLRDL